jgi:hypothetical protein
MFNNVNKSHVLQRKIKKTKITTNGKNNTQL